jgi:alkyl sulfatase BDS1-like metallo-beta-lactamase superfamily hydrolase
VMAAGQSRFQRGQLSVVVRVMDQVVFADPSNSEAGNLVANAFEQLGYFSESAPWRNSY